MFVRAGQDPTNLDELLLSTQMAKYVEDINWNPTTHLSITYIPLAHFAVMRGKTCEGAGREYNELPNLSSTDECSELCLADPNCTAFEFRPDMNGCYTTDDGLVIGECNKNSPMCLCKGRCMMTTNCLEPDLTDSSSSRVYIQWDQIFDPKDYLTGFWDEQKCSEPQEMVGGKWAGIEKNDDLRACHRWKPAPGMQGNGEVADVGTLTSFKRCRWRTSLDVCESQVIEAYRYYRGYDHYGIIQLKKGCFYSGFWHYMCVPTRIPPDGEHPCHFSNIKATEEAYEAKLPQGAPPKKCCDPSREGPCPAWHAGCVGDTDCNDGSICGSENACDEQDKYEWVGDRSATLGRGSLLASDYPSCAPDYDGPPRSICRPAHPCNRANMILGTVAVNNCCISDLESPDTYGPCPSWHGDCDYRAIDSECQDGMACGEDMACHAPSTGVWYPDCELDICVDESLLFSDSYKPTGKGLEVKDPVEPTDPEIEKNDDVMLVIVCIVLGLVAIGLGCVMCLYMCKPEIMNHALLKCKALWSSEAQQQLARRGQENSSNLEGSSEPLRGQRGGEQSNMVGASVSSQNNSWQEPSSGQRAIVAVSRIAPSRTNETHSDLHPGQRPESGHAFNTLPNSGPRSTTGPMSGTSGAPLYQSWGGRDMQPGSTIVSKPLRSGTGSQLSSTEVAVFTNEQTASYVTLMEVTHRSDTDPVEHSVPSMFPEDATSIPEYPVNHHSTLSYKTEEGTVLTNATAISYTQIHDSKSPALDTDMDEKFGDKTMVITDISIIEDLAAANKSEVWIPMDTRAAIHEQTSITERLNFDNAENLDQSYPVHPVSGSGQGQGASTSESSGGPRRGTSSSEGQGATGDSVRNSQSPPTGDTNAPNTSTSQKNSGTKQSSQGKTRTKNSSGSNSQGKTNSNGNTRTTTPNTSAFENWASQNPDLLGSRVEGVCTGTEVSKLKLLGRGNFGNCYLSNMDGIDIVLKVPTKLCSMDDFVREIRTLKEMPNHPCVLLTYGIAEVTYGNSRTMAMVMPYYEAGSLSKRLAHGDLKWKNGKDDKWFTIVTLAKDIATGVLHLHMLNPPMIHRDLAARNILIKDWGAWGGGQRGRSRFQAVVSDFGSAIKNEGRSSLIVSARWAAIEVLRSGDYSIASDVWSYGVVLWEMLTGGEQPWKGIKSHALLKLLMEGQRLPLPQGVPDYMKAIIMQCWTESPSDRANLSQVKTLLLKKIAELDNDLTFAERKKRLDDSQKAYDKRVGRNGVGAARMVVSSRRGE